jgi:hypothetical protein
MWAHTDQVLFRVAFHANVARHIEKLLHQLTMQAVKADLVSRCKPGYEAEYLYQQSQSMPKPMQLIIWVEKAGMLSLAVVLVPSEPL